MVVGFDVEKTGRVHSLHLAWAGVGLVYAGSVEIGIDDATARELHERLVLLRQPRPPLAAAVKGVRPQWVKPQVLVEVVFPNAQCSGPAEASKVPRHSRRLVDDVDRRTTYDKTARTYSITSSAR